MGSQTNGTRDMVEVTHIDALRLKHLFWLTDAKLDRYARRVIWHVKRLPKEGRQSGDDSGLENTWAEFKYQIQRGESIFFEMYEDMILSIARDIVLGMPEEEQGLLWLYCDEFYDPEWEDQIPYGDPVEGAVAQAIYGRVFSFAADEELKFDPDAR